MNQLMLGMYRWIEYEIYSYTGSSMYVYTCMCSMWKKSSRFVFVGLLYDFVVQYINYKTPYKREY